MIASWTELASGALATIRLSALAMVLGLVIAVLCAAGKSNGPRPLRFFINLYIELIRNTPFLVQIFVLFFGLPAFGIRLAPNVAALTALSINAGAYATEIVRAGIEAIPRGQMEAGRALGLRPLQIFRYVVLQPALAAVYPALTSQFILLMLGSSVVSAISADELTSAANDIQSRTFASFETYTVVTAIYLGLSLIFSGLFSAVYKLTLDYPRR